LISVIHFIRFMSSGRPKEANILLLKMFEECQNQENNLLSCENGKSVCLEVLNSFSLSSTLCKTLMAQQVLVLVQGAIRLFHLFRLDETKSEQKQEKSEQHKEYVLDVICNMFHNLGVCVDAWSGSEHDDVQNVVKMLVLKLMQNQHLRRSWFLSTKLFYYLEIFMKNNPQLSDLSTYVPAQYKSGFVDYLRNKKMSEDCAYKYQCEFVNDPNNNTRVACAKRRTLLKRKWKNLESEVQVLEPLYEYPSVNGVPGGTNHSNKVVSDNRSMSNTSQVAEATLQMLKNVSGSLKGFNVANTKKKLLTRERAVILQETQLINAMLQSIMNELSS